MNRATVVTPYAGTGVSTSDAYRALVADDYPGIVFWANVTGQASAQVIPSPNTFTVVVICDDATLAAIQTDPAYVVLTALPA